MSWLKNRTIAAEQLTMDAERFSLGMKFSGCTVTESSEQRLVLKRNLGLVIGLTIIGVILLLVGIGGGILWLTVAVRGSIKGRALFGLIFALMVGGGCMWSAISESQIDFDLARRAVIRHLFFGMWRTETLQSQATILEIKIDDGGLELSCYNRNRKLFSMDISDSIVDASACQLLDLAYWMAKNYGWSLRVTGKQQNVAPARPVMDWFEKVYALDSE